MAGEDKVKRGGGSNNNNGVIIGNTESNYNESDFFNKNRSLFDKIAVRCSLYSLICILVNE